MPLSSQTPRDESEKSLPHTVDVNRDTHLHNHKICHLAAISKVGENEVEQMIHNPMTAIGISTNNSMVSYAGTSDPTEYVSGCQPPCQQACTPIPQVKISHQSAHSQPPSTHQNYKAASNVEIITGRDKFRLKALMILLGCFFIWMAIFFPLLSAKAL